MAGTPYTGNFWLNQRQMEANARYFRELCMQYTNPYFTINAMAGILGNAQIESTINPGIWQNLDEGNLELGYGLVQWTPATKYLDWCDQQRIEPSEMSSAVDRINLEAAYKIQYAPSAKWPAPKTFKEYLQSTDYSPEDMASIFLYNYERPGDPLATEERRRQYAAYWYTFLGGADKFKFIFYRRRLF